MPKEITISIRIGDDKQPSSSKHIQELQRKLRARLMKEEQLVKKGAELEQLRIKQLAQRINRKNHTIDLSLALTRNRSGLMKLLEKQLQNPSYRLKGDRVMTSTVNNERHPQLPHQIEKHSLVLVWNVNRSITQFPFVRIEIDTNHSLLFFNGFRLVQIIQSTTWQSYPESVSDALTEAQQNPHLINASDFWRTDRNTFLKPQPLSR